MRADLVRTALLAAVAGVTLPEDFLALLDAGLGEQRNDRIRACRGSLLCAGGLDGLAGGDHIGLLLRRFRRIDEVREEAGDKRKREIGRAWCRERGGKDG